MPELPPYELPGEENQPPVFVSFGRGAEGGGVVGDVGDTGRMVDGELDGGAVGFIVEVD
jgi:hypothetical protein